MATVYEKPRGSRNWYLSWGSRATREAIPLGPDITTRRQALDAKERFEAERRLAVGSARTRKVAPGVATLRQAVEAFVRDKQATAAASTQVYYRTHVRNFEKSRALPLGKALSAITTEDLEKFRQERAREVAPPTVNKELGTLRAIWALALRRRMTTLDPIAAVVNLREDRAPEDEPEPASRDVVACALRVLRARARSSPEHAGPYVVFANALRIGLHSGLRLGELTRLRPNDLRADGALRVRATRVKGGNRFSVRWTAIPRPIARLLARLAKLGHETLLASARSGGAAYSSLRQVRDEFAKRYPVLRTAGFHSLRHALATSAAEVLEDSTRSDLLGHRRIEQTEHYTHREVERVRAAQDAVRAAERERRRRGQGQGRA